MSNKIMKELNRRNFLRAGSASLASSLLLSNAGHAFNANASETLRPRASLALQDEPAIENISVGYWLKSEVKNDEQLRLESLPQVRLDADVLKLERNPEGLSVRGVKSIKYEDIPEGAPFKVDSADAESGLSSGDPQFAQKGVKIILHGMFASGRQWKNLDRGSFTMKLVFKAYENCCEKISSASIGTAFVARQNDFVAEISSGFTAFDGAPIDADQGLKMSFDLIDVYDPRDRGIVLTILDTVAKLSSLEGILGTAGVAAPYIGAGSAILDALGIHLLSDTKENVQIWSQKNFVQFYLGTGMNLKKLKRGTYFIGGQPKGGGMPAWGTYQLRASDPGNTGPKRYLFKDNPKDKRIDPVDFTYIMISVDYASKLPTRDLRRSGMA